MSYIVPVFLFSAIFNIPKCFETAVVEQIQQEKRLGLNKIGIFLRRYPF